MNTRMIEVENLSFRYGKRRAKVLEDFSIKLDKGSVYGLLGKNGTGKSTLLYLMAGLLRRKQEMSFIREYMSRSVVWMLYRICFWFLKSLLYRM